jgi:hypothetical protein
MWVKTVAGKNMPVDPEVVTIMVAKAVPESHDLVYQRMQGYVPHHITCPKAELFKRAARRKKAREAAP